MVHPSAFVDATATLAAGVRIGPAATIGPGCVVGAGTRIHTRAILVENTVLGANNTVHPFAVLGGDPQDRKFEEGEAAWLVIGDGNVFREHCTVNRGAGAGAPTRIGSGCYLMTGSHVGHNAQMGDDVTMANSSALAGHAQVGSGVFFSSGSGVHQHCVVGDLVMFQVGAAATMHTPPYVMLANGVNRVAGLNRVGLARSRSLDGQDREEIKRAYRMFYRQRVCTPVAEILRSADALEWAPAARRFIEFVRRAVHQAPFGRRGVCGPARALRTAEAPSGL